MVRRDIVPFVRARPIILLLVAWYLIIFLTWFPAARVALFGKWGFHNLLRCYERTALLNSGAKHEIGVWYQFGSAFFVPYSDTVIGIETGPLLRVYERGTAEDADTHTIVEPDATGLYSVFTVEFPELELELQLTLHEVNHTRVGHQEYLGEGVLVKMAARPRWW